MDMLKEVPRWGFPAMPTSVLVTAAACLLIGSASTALGQEYPPEITDPADRPKKSPKNSQTPKLVDQFVPFLRLGLVEGAPRRSASQQENINERNEIPNPSMPFGLPQIDR